MQGSRKHELGGKQASKHHSGEVGQACYAPQTPLEGAELPIMRGAFVIIITGSSSLSSAPYVDPPTSLTTASASYGPGFVSVFLLAIMVMVASYATSRMRYAEYTQLGLINTKPTHPMLPLRTK